MDVWVVVVGDEILAGHVQDANAHFITARARTTGHRVRRVAVVGDDPSEIAEEVGRGLASGARIVFVCGGIGPTHDDRTMEGVAAALGVGLATSSVLSSWVDTIVARVEGQGLPGASWGFDALRKMERVPDGAEVLPNPDGYIPVVVYATGRAHVVVLPGPPRELQAVFGSIVEPRFLAGTGDVVITEELRHPFFESTLAATLTSLQERYPAAAIGSYPQTDHTLVRVSGPEGDARAAAVELRAHLDALTDSDEGRRLMAYIEARRRGRDPSA